MKGEDVAQKTPVFLSALWGILEQAFGSPAVGGGGGVQSTADFL